MTTAVSSVRPTDSNDTPALRNVEEQGATKTTSVFQKNIPLSEKEYYIQKIMSEKNVSREVAEAEYDFFS